MTESIDTEPNSYADNSYADNSAVNDSNASSWDANEADVQEQAEPVGDVEVANERTESLEVDEFDATEQGRSVVLDPDEYR
jgi:hypothetical protein